jgi:hypothetical protein
MEVKGSDDFLNFVKKRFIFSTDGTRIAIICYKPSYLLTYIMQIRSSV